MHIVRYALGLAALLSGLGSAQAATCQLKQFASVPADFRGSQIQMDVTINDQPARLLVDTGAGASMLDPGFAARLGLPMADTGTTGYGLTGRGLTGVTKVATLKLGNAVSRDASFGLAHLGSDGQNGAPVGLFAADYLSNYDVEIDPAGGKLNLFSQDHCRGEVVYWAKEFFRVPVVLTQDRRLDVELELDGKSLHGLVDTGAGATALRLAVARRMFDIDPAAEGLKHGAAIGVDATKVDAFQHVFDSLAFGGITLRNTPVQILDMDVGRGTKVTGSHIAGLGGQEDVIIGMSLLRKLHVFIAYEEPALYFTVPGAN
jgi:predicted aspartyl protease